MVHKSRRSVQSWILIYIWWLDLVLLLLAVHREDAYVLGCLSDVDRKRRFPWNPDFVHFRFEISREEDRKVAYGKSNFAGYVQEATSSSQLGTTQLQRCFPCPILKKCKTPTFMSLSIAVALRRLRKTIQESKCELLHNTAIQRSLKYRTGRAVAASYVVQVCGPRTVDSPSSAVSRTIPVTNSSLWSDPRSTKCMAY